jgi:hypothetical protein
MKPRPTRSVAAWVFFSAHTIWVTLVALAVRSGVLRGEMDAAGIWYFQFYLDLPVSLLSEPFQRLFCLLLQISGKNPADFSWLTTHHVPYTLYALVIGGCQYYAVGYFLHCLFIRLIRRSSTS